MDWMGLGPVRKESPAITTADSSAGLLRSISEGAAPGGIVRSVSSSGRLSKQSSSPKVFSDRDLLEKKVAELESKNAQLEAMLADERSLTTRLLTRMDSQQSL